MAAVKSRIPQGRPSRIPGGNASRQSSHTTRLKFNNQVSNTTTDNCRIAQVKNKQHLVEVDLHQASVNKDLDSASDSQESEDNCEVVSLSSADPSPSKEIHNFQGFDASETDGFYQQLSKLDRAKESNSIHRSGTSSACSSVVDSSAGNKKMHQTSSYGKKSSKNAIEMTRPSSLKSRSKPSATISRQNGPSSKLRDFGKTSNPNTSHLSAANAMEYVKKLTGHGVTVASGNSKLADEYVSRNHNDTSRVTSKDFVNEKSRGKRPNVLEMSTETKSRPNSSRNEKSGRCRSERRMLYQEAKERSLRNGDDAMHESDDDSATIDSGVTSRPKQSSDVRRAGGRSPRIARPVMRPPRVRAPETTEPQEEVELASDDAPKEDEPVNHRSDGRETPPVEDELTSCTGSVRRRGSVPESKVGRQRQQRRRASEMLRTPQDPLNGEANPMHSIASGAGDAEIQDFTGQKERLRQNERYRDILGNPDIVTYGHYRLQQEGNYAPEEKYGVTERRRIRSSTDSDTVSPTRGVFLSFPEQDDTVEPITSTKVIKPHRSNHDVTQSSLLRNNDVTEASSHSDHVTDTDDLSNSMMKDLPSLDSTALMCDLTMSSTSSTPHVPVTETHVINHVQPSELEKTLTKELCEQDVRNGVSDPGNSLVYSSPLRSRAASDDILRFNEAAATATSRGYLKSAFDELTTEYQLVRVTLEELYARLNEEEHEKLKLEDLVGKLRSKNSTLHEEINQLTRILEFQHASPSKHRPHHSTLNAGTQTEKSKVWFKTELRAMKDELASAVEQIRKAKEIRNSFDETVASAEEKLEMLLKEFPKI